MMCELQLCQTAETEHVRVFPAYMDDNYTNQLATLQNLQSWIDGERKRISAAQQNKESAKPSVNKQRPKC